MRASLLELAFLAIACEPGDKSRWNMAAPFQDPDLEREISCRRGWTSSLRGRGDKERDCVGSPSAIDLVGNSY